MRNWVSSSANPRCCSQRTRCTSDTFDALLPPSSGRVNIDSPKNAPPDVDPVEAAHEPALVPRLDAVCVAGPVQPHVGVDHALVDPAQVTVGPGGRARPHDRLERGVAAHLEPAAADLAGEVAGHMEPVKRKHGPGVGAEPLDFVRHGVGHGKQALAVGPQQQRGCQPSGIGFHPPIGYDPPCRETLSAKPL